MEDDKLCARCQGTRTLHTNARNNPLIYIKPESESPIGKAVFVDFWGDDMKITNMPSFEAGECREFVEIFQPELF